MSENPWWYSRCTHGWQALQTWEVIREVEAVVVLYDLQSNLFHVTIDLPGVGSSCKTLTRAQIDGMNDSDLLKYIQSQRRELRSMNQM